jgi:hypothetical protein
MFVRKKVNKSGSISVQVISKIKGKSKLIKTIGSSKDEDTIKEWSRIWTVAVFFALLFIFAMSVNLLIYLSILALTSHCVYAVLPFVIVTIL